MAAGVQHYQLQGILQPRMQDRGGYTRSMGMEVLVLKVAVPGAANKEGPGVGQVASCRYPLVRHPVTSDGVARAHRRPAFGVADGARC